MNALTAVMISAGLLISCGNGDETQRSSNQNPVQTKTASESGLSDFELEHGIGPVTERVETGEIDLVMVDQGRSIFEMKCEACHNMESRLVGPALGEVMERRSTEFVMNFILNPSGMTREHPIGQELLQEYMTPMPFQNVSKEEVRAIVEFLRAQSEN